MAREKRLRRAILRTIDSGTRGGPLDGISGSSVADTIAGLPDVRDQLEATFETIDELVMRLGRDLVNLGLVTVRDIRTMKHERLAPEWLIYSITAKGTALLSGAVPVEPLVEDERRTPNGI